jgi:hypothetical protein
MSVYCNSECEIVGAVCDFCIHYQDDNTNGKFQGEGLCKAKEIRVEAYFSCDDDFHYFQAEDSK